MEAIRYELLPEEDVTEARLTLAGDLLFEAFGQERARGRGWIRRRPLYRVLAWDGDTLVGTEMGCLVGCKPPLAVHGFGDVSVREGWRGHGIARAMGVLVLDEAARRGADAAICETKPLARLVLELDMEAVLPGELYLGSRRRRKPLVEDWYVRWYGEKTVPLVIDGRF